MFKRIGFYFFFMTTLSPIKLTCSICKNEFDSSSVMSFGFGSKRTDFRPNYWGFNPVNYFYHICPHCGFCAVKEIFENEIENEKCIKEIKELGSLNELQSKVLSNKLERAVQCAYILNKHEVLNYNDYDFGNMWILAYWWSKSKEEEIRYGNNVISCFKKALAENLILEKEEILTVKYLIGEIYRRIGNSDEAIKYYDSVILETENDEEFKKLHDLAMQQKTNPKELLE